MTLLRTENLKKIYHSGDEDLIILQQIDFQLHHGESVAIVGPSGCGKSTLLGLLAGLDTPSDGTVFWDEQDIFKLTEEARARLRARRVSFIFQNFQLLPGMSALDNVRLPLSLFRFDNARERAQQMLSKVGLGHRLSHLPQQLSGGEQQRVALARALALEPKLLFADEPTANLDRQNGSRIIELLFDLVADAALVLVTHDVQLAARCQRTLHLAEGRLQAPATD